MSFDNISDFFESQGIKPSAAIIWCLVWSVRKVYQIINKMDGDDVTPFDKLDGWQ